MDSNVKEQERAELHRTIWGIANDLRGSVDGWDFKQYVLGMLFYRYISENLSAYVDRDERAAGNADFRYAALSDADAESARGDLVRTKGFFILPSQLFENVRARALGRRTVRGDRLQSAVFDQDMGSREIRARCLVAQHSRHAAAGAGGLCLYPAYPGEHGRDKRPVRNPPAAWCSQSP